MDDYTRSTEAIGKTIALTDSNRKILQCMKIRQIKQQAASLTRCTALRVHTVVNMSFLGLLMSRRTLLNWERRVCWEATKTLWTPVSGMEEEKSDLIYDVYRWTARRPFSSLCRALLVLRGFCCVSRL